jgi:hypothetical protein
MHHAAFYAAPHNIPPSFCFVIVFENERGTKRDENFSMLISVEIILKRRRDFDAFLARRFEVEV